LTTIGNNAFEGTLLTEITIPDTAVIGDDAFSGCQLQIVKINCKTPGSNNILTILNSMRAKCKCNSNCSTTDIHTLKVALTSSLLESFEEDKEALLDYIKGILEIGKDNGVIDDILDNKEGLFELDLSNAELTPQDIDSIPELDMVLPWKIILLVNEEKIVYTPGE
jgi:hypothetical protein